MRESIGSTWTFGLIMIFTLIFSAFLVLALTYSKAYKLKNEMTTMIEKYEGLTNDHSSQDINNKANGMGSITIINQYLNNSNYSTKGNCPDGSYGINLADTSVPSHTADSSRKYNYCISYTTNNSNCHTVFTITLFYDFDLPVIGHLVKFRIGGQTNDIYNAYFRDTSKPIACTKS